jgi:hypothetical protein
MAVKQSALRAGRPLPPGIFLVYPRDIVRLKLLGQLKNSITSSETESATFLFVAQYLNHIRYLVLA